MHVHIAAQMLYHRVKARKKAAAERDPPISRFTRAHDWMSHAAS